MLAPYLGSTQLSPAGYYCLTYVSLLLIYLLALAIQSAYQVSGCRPPGACSARTSPRLPVLTLLCYT